MLISGVRGGGGGGLYSDVFFDLQVDEPITGVAYKRVGANKWQFTVSVLDVKTYMHLP